MVGAICYGEQCVKRELSFEEILLDETLIQGDIWVLKRALQSVGGINYRLREKRNYELLVRIAKEYRVLLLGEGNSIGTDGKSGQECLPWEGEAGREGEWICLEQEVETVTSGGGMGTEEGLKTDCYLIGRYRTELVSMGCFADAVQGILSVGDESLTRYLEWMIAGTKQYYDIYDCTQPILIYVGIARCYDVYDTFSRYLGHALEELGQSVEYFDLSKQPIQEMACNMKRRYKAVISMHYSILYLRSEKGFIHDEIMAPKYHFTFDHPIWEKEFLEQKPHSLCVLTQDSNYVKFIEQYYGHPARFLPPAGREDFCDVKERDYEIAFLGGYYGGGLAENIQVITEADRETRLLNRYILYMRKNLKETPEHAFKRALEYYGLEFNDKEFVEMFYNVRDMILLLASYYRNKVIETLLSAGITLHVFGNTWRESPMWGNPGLIHHGRITGKDALEVYARSRLSLNIMMWHKDGFTERIADAMLQKSLVVTDKTSYLEKNFVSGEDILMFDLDRLEELPGRIRELLGDEEKRRRMAENGYRKAVQQHTWSQRAGKILEFIEEDRAL